MAGSRVPFRIYRRTTLEHGNVIRFIEEPAAGVIELQPSDEQHILVEDAASGVSIKLPAPQKGMWFEIGNREDDSAEAISIVDHEDEAVGSVPVDATGKYLAAVNADGDLEWVEFSVILAPSA